MRSLSLIRSLSPFSQATTTAQRPLTSTAATAAPTLLTDASSLSAFGLVPHDLIAYPPGSLSRVAGVDGERTLWVELFLDEIGNENDETGDDDDDDGESNGLSLRSALSPTALRPGDTMTKAPEHVRIDFEAGRARRDQKLQRMRAEPAAAAAAAASKAEQAKEQKGRVRR